MKRLEALRIVILLCAAGIAAYIWYSRSSLDVESPSGSTLEPSAANRLPKDSGEQILKDAYDQQEKPPPPPPMPPPPPPGLLRNGEAVASLPDPPRTLIGLTNEDLRQIEQYLPGDAKIYTYPVGASDLAAAIISDDLDGYGKDETVVVYNKRKPMPQEGSLPLVLSVLIREGKSLIVHSSANLVGGVFFSPQITEACA